MKKCIISRHKGGPIFFKSLMSIDIENHGGPFQKSSFICFFGCQSNQCSDEESIQLNLVKHHISIVTSDFMLIFMFILIFLIMAVMIEQLLRTWKLKVKGQGQDQVEKIVVFGNFYVIRSFTSQNIAPSSILRYERLINMTKYLYASQIPL